MGKRLGIGRIIRLAAHASDVPVFLLALVDKGARGSLSKAERDELSKVLPQIAAAYRAGAARQVAGLRNERREN